MAQWSSFFVFFRKTGFNTKEFGLWKRSFFLSCVYSIVAVYSVLMMPLSVSRECISRDVHHLRKPCHNSEKSNARAGKNWYAPSSLPLAAGPHHRSGLALPSPDSGFSSSALLAAGRYNTAPGFGVAVHGHCGRLFRHGWLMYVFCFFSCAGTLLPLPACIFSRWVFRGSRFSNELVC